MDFLQNPMLSRLTLLPRRTYIGGAVGDSLAPLSLFSGVFTMDSGAGLSPAGKRPEGEGLPIPSLLELGSVSVSSGSAEKIALRGD